jgi:hypothetical protein
MLYYDTDTSTKRKEEETTELDAVMRSSEDQGNHRPKTDPNHTVKKKYSPYTQQEPNNVGLLLAPDLLEVLVSSHPAEFVEATEVQEPPIVSRW